MASDELMASPVGVLWDGEAPSHVATRTRNGLGRRRIGTVGELAGRTAAELAAATPAAGRSLFGAACLAEARRVLAARGLALKGDPPPARGALRDARGLPYELVTDAGHVVIVTASGALRLGLREREEFEAAYKQALTEADGA